MQRFGRIAHDESDNSNLDAGEMQQDAIEQKELELSRFIERSLARSGGALFSDANFLGSSLRLGAALDRPLFDAGASDSGVDDIEVLDESNLAAIQQEMVEAGYSASEIRDSLQQRIVRQHKNAIDNDDSSSNSQQSHSVELVIKSQNGGAPDFEMS